MKVILSLVAIYLASVSARGYLAVHKLKAAHDPSNKLAVKCFYNGIWQICPDPFDEDELESLNKEAKRGLYRETPTYKVSPEFLDDPENWYKMRDGLTSTDKKE